MWEQTCSGTDKGKEFSRQYTGPEQCSNSYRRKSKRAIYSCHINTESTHCQRRYCIYKSDGNPSTPPPPHSNSLVAVPLVSSCQCKVLKASIRKEHTSHLYDRSMGRGRETRVPKYNVLLLIKPMKRLWIPCWSTHMKKYNSTCP